MNNFPIAQKGTTKSRKSGGTTGKHKSKPLLSDLLQPVLEKNATGSLGASRGSKKSAKASRSK